MHKKLILTLLALMLLLVALVGAGGGASALTIPTRTPTPDPGDGGGGGNPPVDPPGGGGGGGGGSNPAPTNTAVPPTATATVVNFAPTPVGGFVPTAEPCSTAPTVEARSRLNVRSGPSTDYAVVSRLVFLETRPIVGRASNAEWWYISLADGSFGWVADFTVDVAGYTGFVPIQPPPDGEIDGPLWEPTPQPGCETVEPPTATPSPIATATITHTPTPVSEETDVVEAESDPISAGDDEPNATPTREQDAAVVAVPPQATESGAENGDGETVTIIEGGSGSDAQATAVPLNIEPSGGGSGSFLPIAGGGLLLAGIAGWFFMRQREQEVTG